MSKQRSKVILPEGYANLNHIQSWRSGVLLANKTLKSLAIQEIIYTVEALLKDPWVNHVVFYKKYSPSSWGFKVQMKKNDQEVLWLEEWIHQTKNKEEHPYWECYQKFKRIQEIIENSNDIVHLLWDDSLEKECLLNKGMDWRKIAEVIGAKEVALFMEKAKLTYVTRR